MDIGLLRELAAKEDLSLEQSGEVIAACLGLPPSQAAPLLADLATNDYGGWTDKWSQKYPAAIAAAALGPLGLHELAQRALLSDHFATEKVAINTLAHAAAGVLPSMLSMYMGNYPVLEEQLAALLAAPGRDIAGAAAIELRRVAVNLEPDELRSTHK